MADQQGGRSLSQPRPRPPWSVVLVAVAVAVVSLAAALGSLLVRGGDDGQQQARTSALTAARERTVDLTSYDVATLDADFAKVSKTATGPFAKEYDTTSMALRETFEQQQAVSKSNVLAAGLESFAPDRAVVVLAVDQIIQTKGAAPRRERNRLRMTLVRPGDTWLVEKVDRL